MKWLFIILMAGMMMNSACLKSQKSPLPKTEALPCSPVFIESRDADSSVNFTSVYSYDSGKLVSEKFYLHDQYYLNPNQNYRETLFSYDKDGKLIYLTSGKNGYSNIHYDGDLVSGFDVYTIESKDTQELNYAFTYSGNHISSVSLTENGQSKGEVFKIDWTADNISKIIEFKDGEMVEWHSYSSYDDTSNFKALLSPHLYDGQLNINEFAYLNKNNILFQDYGLSDNISGWFIDYTYIFNEDKRPISLITKDHWNDVITYFFEWQCPED